MQRRSALYRLLHCSMAPEFGSVSSHAMVPALTPASPSAFVHAPDLSILISMYIKCSSLKNCKKCSVDQHSL